MFGVKLPSQLHELLLLPHGFQLHQILCIQRHVPAIPPLMKEILRDQYNADIPVMTAFLEQVAHLLRIYDVQQIVEYHEARPLSLRVPYFLGDALVATDVSAQGGDSRSLAIAPDFAACKMAFGAECIDVLQETDAKGRLARPAGPTDNARKWRLKFHIVNHRRRRCALLPTSQRSKFRGNVHPSFIRKREGRLVT